MTDTDTDTMPEPGYNIGNAACVVANSGLFTAAAVKMARLALAEHERAETLARRVAELEAELSDLRPLAVGRRLPGEAVCTRDGDDITAADLAAEASGRPHDMETR